MSEAIGKRAVDCKHWRWMPGMRIRGIDKVCVAVTAKGCPVYRDGYGILTPVPHAQPDLTDPATLGCLLVLVRDAHRDAYMTIGCVDGDWGLRRPGCDGLDRIVTDCDGHEVSRGRSEREALVAALEAAE